LLASEASDIELEVLDLLRKTVKATLGDVAIDDAWEVQRLSTTQILIKPGEAWFKGLPFAMRSGKDQQVSGASLSLGIVPAGVIATDDSTGLGKIITFNSGGTTPTDLYRLVVVAREERITDVDDPFLKNANLVESTAQKIRLNFKLNIVSESDQDESPIPYTNDTTNENLVNQIQVNPVALQNGSLVSLNVLSGSENIDGRDLELIIRNDPGMGGGNPIPNGTTDQQTFYNGKFIDGLGCEYHINAIFNDTISTQVVIRIDKEPGQPNPQIVNGSPYYLVKRDVYVSDDVNGSPQGKLFWPIATLNWDSVDGIVHSTSISDLRDRVITSDQYQQISNTKFDLRLTGGGNPIFDSTSETLSWGANFVIINPHGPQQNILSGAAVLMDGGSLVYDMNLESGGNLGLGSIAITTSSTGSTVNVSSGTLTNIRIGNVLKRGSEVVEITGVDEVNQTLDVSPALATMGSGTVYLDSFAPAKAPKSEKIYTLAVRKGNSVWIDGIEVDLGAVYDESLEVVAVAPGAGQILGPILSGTPITLPGGQMYSLGKDQLKVYTNGLFKEITRDYLETNNTQVSPTYDILVGSIIRFRIR